MFKNIIYLYDNDFLQHSPIDNEFKPMKTKIAKTIERCLRVENTHGYCGRFLPSTHAGLLMMIYNYNSSEPNIFFWPLPTYSLM